MSERLKLECDPELLMAMIQEQNASDDESWDKSGTNLLATYNNGNSDIRGGIDAALMAFTGWTMLSLVARANEKDVNDV